MGDGPLGLVCLEISLEASETSAQQMVQLVPEQIIVLQSNASSHGTANGDEAVNRGPSAGFGPQTSDLKLRCVETWPVLLTPEVRAEF